MTPRPHSDTETRLAGFEARLQDAFAWANEHGREIMVGLGVLLLTGAILSGVYEWRRRAIADEETELARIEMRFTTAMGANPGEPSPRRRVLWIPAGDASARGNAPERAIAAYREALSVAPELAQQEGIVQRIGIQQAHLDAGPKPEPAAAPEAAKP